MRDLRAGQPRSERRRLSDPCYGLSDLLEETRTVRRRSVPNIQPNVSSGGRAALAEAEEDAIARGSLEEDAARNQHKRSEATKGFIHGCAIWTGRAITAVFVVLFAIWAWHIACPVSFEFLPPEKVANLADLIKLVFSSAAGALVMKYYSKHI